MRALLFLQGPEAHVAGYSIEGATPSEVERYRLAYESNGPLAYLQGWFHAGWKLVDRTINTTMNYTTVVVLELPR